MQPEPLQTSANPLGTAPIGKLLPKFAIPSVIAFLVSSLYNIVDQIFIGQGVGLLGNAATNVAFPFNNISTAIALLMSIGTAANFNLNLGAGHKDRAREVAGTGGGSGFPGRLSGRGRLPVPPSPAAGLRRYAGCASLRPHLYPHHRLRPAAAHLYHRMQQFDPRRRQPHLFHALYPVRRGPQHHVGPFVHLRL